MSVAEDGSSEPVTVQPTTAPTNSGADGHLAGTTTSSSVMTASNAAAESVAMDEVSAGETNTTVSKSQSWFGGWGSYLQNAVQQPHVLETGLNAAYNQVAQATTGATAMVKSKSMEVVKAVSGDLNEVKESVKSAATPYIPMVGGAVGGASSKIADATGSLKSTIKELDEVTDELTEAAITGVSKSVSSIWNIASGYASQMFTEDDLPAESVLVGPDSEPIILDRLQAQLHALATDLTTYTKEPDPKDGLSDDWAEWLAALDLDKRQGEISALMINNAAVRKMYTKLVPAEVSHKHFWARYFYKVHLIEKLEVKRQVLKKRAAEKTNEEETDINWDDDDEDESQIPEEVQEKLLTDYENELKKQQSTTTTVKQHVKQDSSASSDDWEKLSDETK